MADRACRVTTEPENWPVCEKSNKLAVRRFQLAPQLAGFSGFADRKARLSHFEQITVMKEQKL